MSSHHEHMHTAVDLEALCDKFASDSTRGEPKQPASDAGTK